MRIETDAHANEERGERAVIYDCYTFLAAPDLPVERPEADDGRAPDRWVRQGSCADRGEDGGGAPFCPSGAFPVFPFDPFPFRALLSTSLRPPLSRTAFLDSSRRSVRNSSPRNCLTPFAFDITPHLARSPPCFFVSGFSSTHSVHTFRGLLQRRTRGTTSLDLIYDGGSALKPATRQRQGLSMTMTT
ncbi:hypothetical protein EVAR_8643_1 [Eumeta japonica]|uniref:Uncharacterized protein n=1 Tax=Eumeta variegata TaxID=151549 RepID=A0A4C1TV87_EUMVA|nr:hypothetical protein EVAR_8643_1 [Eumeta japonica]